MLMNVSSKTIPIECVDEPSTAEAPNCVREKSFRYNAFSSEIIERAVIG